LALISTILPLPVAMRAARHHGDTLSVPAKQRRKPVLTGKGIIATKNATSNASSITPIAGPTNGTSSTRDAASGGDDGGSAGSAGGTASNGVSVETLVVVAVPPKQRRKRVTTASRKNTTRDSSSVHGSDGDGILSVCGGHHVVTTGKAGTVKVKGKKSKVAGGGDRGGRSGGDTVAVLVKRRKRVAADSSSPTTSPATTSRPASSTTAATDASGRGRGRGRGRAGDSVSAGTAAFNNKKVRAAKKRMAELHVAATEALGIAVGRPWAVHENGPFSGVRGHLLTIMADPGRYHLNTQLVGSPPSVTPVPTRGFVLALHRHESVHVGRLVLQVVGVDRRKSSPCLYFAVGEFQQQVRLQLTDSTHIALGVITTELLSCGDVYNPGNLLEVTAWWSCPFAHENGGRTSISMIISSAK
jgi:hypothetical protein